MTKPDDDIWKNQSLEDSKFGIGQRADGTFDVFPLSELAARLAADREQDEATTHAIAETFPESEEAAENNLGDLSDLDDVEKAFG